MRRLVKRLLLIIFGLFLVICVGLFILLRQTNSDSIAVTNLEQYPEILDSFAENPAVEHFPKEISSQALEAHLYYFPRLFQTGTVFQLRLKLPLDEILAEQQRFLSKSLSSTERNIAPLPNLRAGNDLAIQFPETFEIILLGAEPAGQGDNIWNHGYTFGIAIDELNSEIVYWYEWW